MTYRDRIALTALMLLSSSIGLLVGALLNHTAGELALPIIIAYSLGGWIVLEMIGYEAKSNE